MGRLLLVLVSVALFASCSNDQPSVAPLSPPPSAPSLAPASSPSLPSALACENQAEVVASQDLREGAPFVADVDGDGEDDQAFFHIDESASVGCQGFLVVETAAGTTMSVPVWEMGNQGGLEAPGFNSAAEINGSPGDELVINEIAGASTQFVGVFTVFEGELQRLGPSETLTTELWTGATEGLFGVGGSVGHLEAVDCIEMGEVVVTTAVPAPSRKAQREGIYIFTRHRLSVVGAELTLAETERTRGPIEDLFEEYPEYSASPFGSC